MKVKTLIELLKHHDPELEVGFEHPSHDYWKTVLIGIVEEVEEGQGIISEYHRAYRQCDDGEEGTKMVVLSGS